MSDKHETSPKPEVTPKHIGEVVLAEVIVGDVIQLFPEPKLAKVYQLPPFRNGQAWTGA